MVARHAEVEARHRLVAGLSWRRSQLPKGRRTCTESIEVPGGGTVDRDSGRDSRGQRGGCALANFTHEYVNEGIRSSSVTPRVHFVCGG